MENISGFSVGLVFQNSNDTFHMDPSVVVGRLGERGMLNVTWI